MIIHLLINWSIQMNTDQIVEQYFESLFPDSHLRADNLTKLGHFLETPETILIIQGTKSTGKMTLFRILTLLTGKVTRVQRPLFINDALYQWGSKLICITQSFRLVRPFPNLKPIIIKCQHHLHQPFSTLPIIIHRHHITTSLQRLLAHHAKEFERYDLVPDYQSLISLVKNHWTHYKVQPHLYTKFIDQMV